MNRALKNKHKTGFCITNSVIILVVFMMVSMFYESNVYAQNSTSWIDTTGGNWNDASKWSNGVPGPNSDVIINIQGNYDVWLQNDVTIKSLTFGNASWGTQTLRFAGYQLTLNGGSSVISDGATTYLTGNIINNGTLTFTGNRKKIITPIFDNQGTININGPVDFYYPFTNEVNCKIDITNNVLIQTEYSGVIINKGTIIKSSGTGRANIQGMITNEDSIIVNSGTLILTGTGPANFWGGTYYAAAGDSLINAVNLTNNASYAKGTLTGNPDGEIIFEGGAFSFYADSTEAILNFGGTGLKWVNGIFNQIGGGSWVNTGKIYVVGNEEKIIAAHFTNDNSFEIAGSLKIFYDSFVNNPGKTVSISDNSSVTSEYSGSIINNGLFQKTGTGAATISSQFENSGTVDITGTLNWNDNFSPDSTSILTIEADPSGNYGNLNITGQAILSGKATVMLNASSEIGDSIVILTAQQGVTDTFYSVESSIDTISLEPSYYTNSVSLKLYRNNLLPVEQESDNLPSKFALEQNYPNPFNPSTSIQYAIGSPQFVSLKVYNVLGMEVTTLVNEEKTTGSYQVDFNAAGLSSGIYFYALKAGNFSTIKKMILLK